MNVERLHAIAIALKSDLAQSGVPSHLQNLLSALQNQVSQPGQPQYQQQVSQFYSALLSALEKSSIDDFSPTWQQVVVELGAADLLGKNLARRIEGVFTANQITPSIASEELQKLLTRLNSLSASIDQLVTAFAQLKIGAEDLDPGECEVGVLVPRAFVDNRLDRFSDELSELNKIFGVFEEISTGSRPSLKIRTISSTDLSIFLDAAPVVGACVATAVDRSSPL